VHHRPRYWAFNKSLISDPEFSKTVGTIYLELPANKQSAVNKFLANKKLDKSLPIEVLRDMLWMGWPDKPMLDFFVEVWFANQKLAFDDRIRIVLVDVERPWSKIHDSNNLPFSGIDRDKYMAEKIINDLQKNRDGRNCIFIVGFAHAFKNLRYTNGDPFKTAGYYLKEAIGKEKIHCIFPHTCIMNNFGHVQERLCMGLFESAFDKMGNREIAFPLDKGPFGREEFDAMPRMLVEGQYRDAFGSYLYLGPLENEIFSPLIENFYTDEFTKEVGRRHEVLFQRTWTEVEGQELTPENFKKWMCNSWGQPRKNWDSKNLPPKNAWQFGGQNWKETVMSNKHQYMASHPENLKQVAKEFFENIRDIDYQYYLKNTSAWREFPISYRVERDYPGFLNWICNNFSSNPITNIMIIETNVSEYPSVKYKLTLENGRILQGELVLVYDPQVQKWVGIDGIDWHYQPDDQSR